MIGECWIRNVSELAVV